MKFFALLLISFAAVCCAADLKDIFSSLSNKLPWNQLSKRDKIIAEDTRDLSLKTIESCKGQSGISAENVQALINGSIQNADEKTKVFVQCYMEGLSLMMDGRQQNNVILDKLGAIYGRKKVYASVFKCEQAGGNNALDKTFNAYVCFANNKLNPIDLQ